MITELFVGMIAIAAGILIGQIIGKSKNEKQTPKSDEEKISTLTRKLIHEIRNPLNSISMNLQLLEEDLIDQSEDLLNSVDRVQRIQNEIDRLDLILTNFRRYTKLPQPNFEIANVADLIHEVLDFNEPEANANQIEIVREIDQNLPPIEVDRFQLKQALLNLILNANQSMETDGGTLIVIAKRNANQIQIEVRDNGIGMDADQINKIFDLFFSTKPDGTGIGLSVAKQIIDSHGGKIIIESELEKGSIFSIRLPINS